MHELELRQRERLAGRLQIDLLPTRHAARAGRERQRLHHVELRARVVGQPVLGEQLEGERLQRIADQQRGRFVVLHVHGRLAAPEHVIVHARHVVVHERVGVDHSTARPRSPPARARRRRLRRPRTRAAGARACRLRASA